MVYRAPGLPSFALSTQASVLQESRVNLNQCAAAPMVICFFNALSSLIKKGIKNSHLSNTYNGPGTFPQTVLILVEYYAVAHSKNTY